MSNLKNYGCKTRYVVCQYDSPLKSCKTMKAAERWIIGHCDTTSEGGVEGQNDEFIEADIVTWEPNKLFENCAVIACEYNVSTKTWVEC